jgi:hypothetical protein
LGIDETQERAHGLYMLTTTMTAADRSARAHQLALRLEAKERADRRAAEERLDVRLGPIGTQPR